MEPETRQRKKNDQSKHIVHELQQPLSAMAMLADLSLESMEDPFSADKDKEIRKNLLQIVEQGQRCKRIIKNMQEPVENIQKNFSNTDVNDILDQTINQLRNHKDHDGITIRQDLQPDLPSIRADAQSLDQLFTNIINNAVDAMQDSPEKKLTISSSEKQNGINIQITDSGCGIDKQHRSHVFESSYTSKGPDGMGYGLAICKSIVDTHHGNISLKSLQNIGTRFIIFLPFNQEKGQD